MKRVLSMLSLVTALALPMPLVAADVNWGSIQPHKVKLFYPGVASWEFVNSNNHGVGRVPVSQLQNSPVISSHGRAMQAFERPPPP